MRKRSIAAWTLVALLGLAALYGGLIIWANVGIDTAILEFW